MSTPEQSGRTEYSNREILREIFKKFGGLKKEIPLGETFHLVIDNKLATKLKAHLSAKKIGFSEEMSIKASRVVKLKLGIPNSSATQIVDGEVFTLFAGDMGVFPLSCISLPLDKLEVPGDLSSLICLAQLDKNGVFGIKAQINIDKVWPDQVTSSSQTLSCNSATTLAK
ncbi:hypothetical protein KKI22_02625 [Patescibacteria group bacterium]|nr:hypothetical protein [Patescibacteria group bacterium]